MKLIKKDRKLQMLLFFISFFILISCNSEDDEEVENNVENDESEFELETNVTNSANDTMGQENDLNPFIPEAPSEPKTYEEVIAYGEGKLAHLDRDDDEEKIMDIVKDKLPSLKGASEEEMQHYWESLLYLFAKDFMPVDGLVEEYELGEFDSEIEGVWYVMEGQLNVLTVLNIGETMTESDLHIAKESIKLLDKTLPTAVSPHLGVRTVGGEGLSECGETELIYDFSGSGLDRYFDIPEILNELSLGEEGHLIHALEEAIKDFDNYPSDMNTNVIYLLTNGVGTCDNDLVKGVNELWEGVGSDIILNVIGVNVGETDKEILEDVADVGGGIYIPASSEEEIEEGLKRTREFTSEWISWKKKEERSAFSNRQENKYKISDFSSSWYESQRLEMSNMRNIIGNLYREDYIDRESRNFLGDRNSERRVFTGEKLDIEVERLTEENEHNYRAVLGKIAGQLALPGKPVVIEEEDEFVMLEIDETFLFDYDDDTLKPEAEEVLDEITDALVKLDGAEVDIHGHTDSDGDADYNQALSERRAQAVKAFFEGEEGLNNVTFTKEGFGETRPTADNDTEEGRAKNRRVEVWIEQH
ncbi:OmpA family protein [Salipaludibacillus daqingensis]|uniref:OmpA family protein n=1 Tax=Salipaludibacillus daqingensis TaxID=3041001 RepID=UPI00247520C6|nr:OmpA family protein [Salipaludibacillus daqingensis]